MRDGNRLEAKVVPTDVINAKQSEGVKVPEYTQSPWGETQQVARLRAVNMHTNLDRSTDDPNYGMKTFDARHLKTEFLPAYEKLEAVILSNGWNNETWDGNIFEDGKGVTVKLYDQFVVSNTTVCETGFGGGHGALYSLLICSDCHIYIFSDKGRPYSEPVATYLEKEYPGRLSMIWGDSNVTMPKFKQDDPSVNCDFAMIDGARSYNGAKADTIHFANLVTSGTTPTIQHDCPIPGLNDTVNGVCRGWHELAKNGCVQIQHEYDTASLGHLNVTTCNTLVPPAADSSWWR